MTSSRLLAFAVFISFAAMVTENVSAMYMAEAGRFVSRDPIGYADGRNMYQYVGSNPLTARDPSGMIGVNCRYQCADGAGMYPVNKVVDCPSLNDAKSCCEKDLPTGCILADYDAFWNVEAMCDSLVASGGCKGCTKADCVSELSALFENADNHTADFPNECWNWVNSFPGSTSGKCFTSKAIGFKYPFGLPGTDHFLRHVVIEVTLCDGSKFFMDSGWWGGSDNRCLPKPTLCKKEGEFPIH